MHPFVLASMVVVELFTSQGCSSCPPADALLSALRNRPNVIPLAFHVDYWDHLGWRDPFSSRQWTQRQMMYVSSMHLNSAYTPQAVVDGAVQFVGSNKSALESAIESGAKRTAAGQVTVEATRSGNSVVANVHAEAPDGYDTVLALFENGVKTSIQAGENSGRAATDDAVVRLVRRVTTGTVTMPVAPSWKNLGVAVFLQNRQTLAIGDAAMAPVILSEAKDLKLRKSP